MEAKRTSVYENSLIWFGAGVSIAEILTGTYFAPLGFRRGLAAILTGHIERRPSLCRAQCPAAGRMDRDHDL